MGTSRMPYLLRGVQVGNETDLLTIIDVDAALADAALPGWTAAHVPFMPRWKKLITPDQESVTLWQAPQWVIDSLVITLKTFCRLDDSL